MKFFSKLLVCVSLFSCIALFANENNVKIKDFDAAAQKGDPRAQYNMGVFFFAGDGVKQDYETAVKWFRKAADQGYGNAQCFLLHIDPLAELADKQRVFMAGFRRDPVGEIGFNGVDTGLV